MIKRIYLAGPGVFYPDPIAEGDRLKKLCANYGLEGVYPMDAGLDISNMTKHEAGLAIYQANIDLIKSVDGVIADMQAFRGPGMDGGTAFEMGFAKALGLPVVGYNTKGHYLNRCSAYYDGLKQEGINRVDPSGLTVEDFDLVDNLMMACGVDALVVDEAAACQWFSDRVEAG
ncbi:nucleoside 2-deoxyribosyltransferase [Terasakiella sp. A23]|uniref:nucleoside 2-deoxyribosyltransferase n=1 Tax=Terasakiella sp. FCG-A23 TaxID=3080561 RepID=UPI002953D9DC|nr:nucleoside 2-deoxyribosyltransferase [Terasakiella sp. A23]MDV7341193.1 nucleoside 2-deoxyribosyltransferase [Terasakiella sp. A23]